MWYLLLSLIFSGSSLDTNLTNGPGWKFNNKVWIKVDGQVSAKMQKLHDSLKCTDAFCSDKRPQFAPNIKQIDSLIFGAICGSQYHVAKKSEYDASNSLFRFLDLLDNGSSNSSNGIQVFYNDELKQYRYFKTDGNYQYELKGTVNLNNDTGFSLYELTRSSSDYYTIIAASLWGNNVPYNVVCVSDFDLIPTQRQIDTVTRIDTIRFRDTVNHIDTLILRDTVNHIDTIIKRDTVRRFDTIIQKDTIIQRDTVYIRDTIRIIETKTVNEFSQILWKSKGSVSQNRNSLSLERSESEQVSIQIKTGESIASEVYIYDNLGVFVASHKFDISASTEPQYITFNGYSTTGAKCADGIYLIRVLTKRGNTFTNNVYKVGLKG
jgi:hypothetical protein